MYFGRKGRSLFYSSCIGTYGGRYSASCNHKNIIGPHSLPPLTVSLTAVQHMLISTCEYCKCVRMKGEILFTTSNEICWIFFFSISKEFYQKKQTKRLTNPNSTLSITIIIIIIVILLIYFHCLVFFNCIT